jgi:hypothetical protein
MTFQVWSVLDIILDQAGGMDGKHTHLTPSAMYRAACVEAPGFWLRTLVDTSAAVLVDSPRYVSINRIANASEWEPYA